jgi:hypothetical protein
MVRKLPNFVSSLFEALMHFLLDIEDDPDWHRVRRACVCACCDHGLSGTAGGGRREAKQTQGQGGGGQQRQPVQSSVLFATVPVQQRLAGICGPLHMDAQLLPAHSGVGAAAC